MSFLSWLILCGAVFLTMALSAAFLRKMPVSSAMLYVLVGVALGPHGVGALSFDAVRDATWFERLTELAVIVSLFVGGLKLRLPLRDPAWRASFRLAGPVMVTTIAGIAAYGHYVLDLSAGEAILLGAVLAPTDPVLAAEAKVENARDQDRLRYALSGEAGLNDGAAFPFVVLGIMLMVHEGDLGAFVTRWALERLVWAVPAGLVFGFVLGFAVGKLTTFLRSRWSASAGFNDFLALALVALSYALAELGHAWGFLAAFAAGVGLRRAEVHVLRDEPMPQDVRELEADVDTSNDPGETPAEAVVERDLSEHARRHPAVAAGTMIYEVSSFGDALERIAEVIVVVLIGVMVSTRFEVRGLPLALLLFMVIRPLSVWIGLVKTPTNVAQRALIGWLGIRGAGSMYYLAYAISRNDGPSITPHTVDLVLTVVVASILVHGITATPLLRWYSKSNT